MTKKMEISPKVAALTLVAFLNAAPELIFLTGSKEKSHDTFSFFTLLLGAIIFSSTLGMASIIIMNKMKILKLPKFAFTLEFCFYIITMISVTIMGKYKLNGFVVSGYLVASYIIYLVISLYG